ncbi:signal peptidase I [Nocardioides dongkuii]|uniref:signal peptidase I n=1 Tax=Nocardioides dongkuii TaxID=2760089 RepID=UPI0015F8471A|nr:signal peptidase I [Nocardioides dongkuii]
MSTGGRVLVVLGVLSPLVVLVLVPMMLGMDRYVVTGDAMDGTLDRGSFVFERPVPSSDLEVGDVITFRPPGSDPDSRVTRRLVELQDGIAHTRGDALATVDPWTLRLDEPTTSKVVLVVPYVGYPFVSEVGRLVWVGVTVAALLSLLTAAFARRRRRTPAMSRVLA